MKIVRTNIVPSGFKAITIWPFIFARKKASMSGVDINHENIHGDQQLEMFTVGLLIAGVLAMWGCGLWSLLALPLYFYWYGIEWLIKSLFYLSFDIGYKNISFEREAYQFEDDLYYLNRRKPYWWITLIL